MEHPDPKEPADDKGAGLFAGNADSPPSSSNGEPPNAAAAPPPWPNTAIERQVARVSAHRYRKQPHQEAAGRMAGRHKAGYNIHRGYNAHRHQSHRLGLASFLVFLVLVAAGLAWVLTDPDRPLQKAIGTVWQKVWPAPATRNPSPVGVAQTPAPKVAEGSTAAELAIPIADISLRRPELLGQLVQVYRSRLAADPTDAAALAALQRLQERSLTELETMIVEGEVGATADQSLQIIARLFPELTGNSRYQYLNSRIDINRQAADQSADKPEQSAPAATTAAPEKTTAPAKTNSPAKAAAPEKAASPEKPIAPEKAGSPEKTIAPEKNAAPEKSAATPIAPAAPAAKKTVAKALPSKPEIRAVSITPGRMVEDRFVAGDDGNVLMVGISYRNFDKISENEAEPTLVTRLGIPGDSTVLAEVPVVIAGDRGTKSFVIETLMPGNTADKYQTGEKYQLNFLLNGEFLTSRTVRLSMPGQ